MDLDDVMQDSNFSTMTMESELMIRKLTLFFVPITFAIILILGLIGNILVIIVVSSTGLDYQIKKFLLSFQPTLHFRSGLCRIPS